MNESGTAQLIEAFLGSTLVFSRAISTVVEEQVLEEAAENQLTSPQLTVLKLIDQAGVRTVGEVAALLGVSNPAASKAVDRLVRRGLISRSEVASDRRATEVALTEPGRVLLARYEIAKTTVLAKTLGRISPDQLRRTARLLDRLSVSLLHNSRKPDETCLQCYMYGRQRCPVRGSSGACQNMKRRLRGNPAAEARL